MKSIRSFINESHKNVEVIFENAEFNAFETIEDVYVSLGDKMQLNEGILSKLAGFFAKSSEKITNFDKKIEDKKKQMSDAAKKALETVKKTAGDTWDKMKDVYTNTVAQIDDAIKGQKGTIAEVCKTTGIKPEELEAKIATIALNTMQQDVEKMQVIFADPEKMKAFNMLVASIMVCVKNKIGSSEMLAIMSGAGVK